jgi:6-phosphogluconolactonase (cycloisomerase 2 family)
MATLSSYAIDSASGQLSPAAEVDLGDMDETFLFVHPTRPLLYVADQSFDGVRVFSAGAAPSPVSTGGALAPRSVAADPLGRFVYLVPSESRDPDGVIHGYALRADGGLTSIGQVANGVRLAIAPSGRFAYAARPASGTIAAHAVDGASGRLSLQSTVAAPDANRLAVDPGGRFLFACGDGFAANGSWTAPAGGVLAFRIDAATGRPSFVGRVQDEPCDYLAADPSGRWLYVSRVRSGDVFAYGIEDGSGTLLPLGPVRGARAGWIGFASFSP